MQKAIRAGFAALLLMPACAGAQEGLAFSTAVDLNYKRLLQTSVTSPTVPGGLTQVNEFTPTLWTLSVSPSLAYRGFFLAVAVERSLSEGTTAGQNSTLTSWLDRRYTRDENSATLGYNFWRGFSAFAGYLHNSTKTKFTNTALTGSGVTSVGRSKFEEDAPYFGLGYSHRFGTGGTAAASFALTSGDATLDQTTITAGSGATTRTFSQGDLKGTSYGLSWSAPLTGSLYYRLGYKGTRYDFQAVDNLGIQRKTKNDYDALYLGVANYF